MPYSILESSQSTFTLFDFNFNFPEIIILHGKELVRVNQASSNRLALHFPNCIVWNWDIIAIR